MLGVGFGVLAGAYEMITPPIQLPDQPPPPKLPFKQVVRAAVRVQVPALRCRSVVIRCISSLAGAGGADERQPCQNAYQVALLEQEFCHRWRFVAVTATPAVSLSPAFIRRLCGCNWVVTHALLLLQACSALWNAVWRATLGSTRSRIPSRQGVPQEPHLRSSQASGYVAPGALPSLSVSLRLGVAT